MCGACALQARGDLRRLERFWNSTIHNSEIEITFEIPPKKRHFFSLLRKTKQNKSKKKKKRSWFCRDTYVTIGAMMTTRETQQKSRMIGKRDSLWGLIVKCDDICFTHILPRLNANDVKFLYGVNTETRKLIKRSSRAGDLKTKFYIGEMSSMSTLEVAWEHKSLWPSGWKDETYFCLELLSRINSSCSSGRERRKSVRGIQGRLMRPQTKVIWKW